MNINKYGEVINGKETYKVIADTIRAGGTIGIGWTDGIYTHLDVIFKLGLDTKCGVFQRGNKNQLFIC